MVRRDSIQEAMITPEVTEFIAAFDRTYAKVFMPEAPLTHHISLRAVARELGIRFNSPVFKSRVEEMVKEGTLRFAPGREAKDNLLIRMPGVLHEQSIGLVAKRPAAKATPVAPEVTGYKQILYRGIREKPVDEGMYGKGTYFSSSKEYASQFGEVSTSEITLQKPFQPKTMRELNSIGDPIFEEARRKGLSYRSAEEVKSQGIRDYLEKQGYDGIVLPTTETGYQEVIVFHPEKSVAIPKAEAAMSEVPVAKEPWQMTQKEWLVDVGYKPNQGTRVRENWLGTHEGEVRVAVQNRKPVPPEVLKDYPGLVKAKTRREQIMEFDYAHTLDELKRMAREKGVSPSGTKHAIIARLI